MDSHSQQLVRIRRIALAIAALSLLLVLVSAWIRLGAAGLGCSPWPECYGRILEGTAPLQGAVARVLHRVVATVILLCGFFLVWQCRQPVVLQPLSRQAGTLLGLMIVLTLVGIWSADPHRVWASFINMLGGVALVSLAWRVAWSARQEPLDAVSPVPTLMLHAGLALLALTVVFGALIGARFAAATCVAFPACGDFALRAGLAALNPVATVAVPAAVGDPGGVALHLLHRVAAAVALLLLAAGAWQAMRHPPARITASLVLGLLVGQFALGVAIVAGGYDRVPAVAHSAGAALLLAAGVDLLLRIRSPRA